MRSILNSYFKTNSLMLCTSTNNKIDCFEIIPFDFSQSLMLFFLFFIWSWIGNFFGSRADSDRIIVSVLRQEFQKISCSADLFHQFPPLTLTENPHLFQFEELFLPPRNFWKSSLAVQQNGRRSGDSSSTAL